MMVYVGTALLQPTLTDQIRYSGGAGNVGWPPTLLAQISNTFAMGSLIILVKDRVRPTLFNRGHLLLTGRGVLNGAVVKWIVICTAIDFSAGIMLTSGLLMLGGSVFVIIYSSTTVWTAIISTCMAQKLAIGRWVGVVVVTVGMVVSSEANFEMTSGDDMATTALLAGVVVCLTGTCLHAAMYVASEMAIKQNIDLLVLCSCMGVIETGLLLLWNIALYASYGASLYTSAEHDIDATPQQLALLYCALTAVNAVHAWAFFHMLEKVGAVSSAVMKGTQLVLVFALSVVFFCRFQATQCFSWSKATGVMTVVLGLLVYAHSTAQESGTQGHAPQSKVRAAKDKEEELIL